MPKPCLGLTTVSNSQGIFGFESYLKTLGVARG